jgi:hypothetical protein
LIGYSCDNISIYWRQNAGGKFRFYSDNCFVGSCASASWNLWIVVSKVYRRFNLKFCEILQYCDFRVKWAFLDTNLGRIHLNLQEQRIYNLGKKCFNEFPGLTFAILHTNKGSFLLNLDNDQVKIVFNGVCDDCDSAAGIGIYELKSANLCTKY